MRIRPRLNLLTRAQEQCIFGREVVLKDIGVYVFLAWPPPLVFLLKSLEVYWLAAFRMSV